MAKKSAVENNNRRMKMVSNKKDTRFGLQKVIRNRTISLDERVAMVHKLAEMPRNSSRVRVRNRCGLTGRPRGFYRKFGMSRIALRELASAGFLPGVTKASW
ncbi:MAG: 30S ribosomal protein S14 [Holosporales bacterium]|jgi:small subunit ribosomal protein S14|nr:30S ribosomal protein S14 [Holosporales bacterium]